MEISTPVVDSEPSDIAEGIEIYNRHVEQLSNEISCLYAKLEHVLGEASMTDEACPEPLALRSDLARDIASANDRLLDQMKRVKILINRVDL